ncbi:MarR family winged helix-turn-helix transcriptional regulator [Cellulomonas gilvus]|uniref:Transcriptional regulator, MarR family n=1 Tax=Cellulomonas gilvus (strain ATCC 13127 / NRRL B-14078) TaxID=593907 RepID=F8A0H1_CELGA|nr:MarR family transcriptional regulator [Cellulomonas gilvus]AEI11515.1 transcriptional regulator, MarR family [Cellulomonas gilvus ATCC 13127]
MTTAPDPLALEAQVCLALSAAARALVGTYRTLLEPLGLTHPQYLAMLALWQDGPQSLARLAERLHLEPATASPLVRRLEARGLVTRRTDERDERALVIALTPEGVALRERAVEIPGQMLERLGLDLADVERVRDSAQLMLDACERAG